MGDMFVFLAVIVNKELWNGSFSFLVAFYSQVYGHQSRLTTAHVSKCLYSPVLWQAFSVTSCSYIEAVVFSSSSVVAKRP